MLHRVKSNKSSLVLMTLLISSCLSACHASQQDAMTDEAVTHEAAKSTAAPVAKVEAVVSGPQLEFRGTISGAVLDLNDGITEETPAVKQFRITGKNPYNDDKGAIKEGYTIYATACSGCHGHLAEGKLGPALHDDYWTYPKNMYDKGFFETIYGGAKSMMGPQKGRIKQDEILKIMSWVRSIYDGKPKKAKWRK